MLARVSTRRISLKASRYCYSTLETSIEGAPAPELDTSYQKLAEDIRLSLNLHKEQSSHATSSQTSQTSEEYSFTNALTENLGDGSEVFKSNQWKRKSPEARLGSNRIGQLKLPFELVSSMQLLIDGIDKQQLRSDAKRLMLKNHGWGARWVGDTPKYSRVRAEREMGPREGLAYATVTLPGQVAAIRAVLHELRTRLPSDWTVENVLDFGSQTGAGFWSTLSFFGNKEKGWEHEDNAIKDTTIKRYIGFDNRLGLVSMAKQIQREKNTGGCVVIHKQFWRELEEYDLLQLGDGRQTLAISAFVLSQLPTPAARKQVIKEMWKSSAETIVVIDQGTKTGFDAVADAREYLLQVGNSDTDTIGAHVVAPCPHDGACPLRDTPDVCSFPQRFISPDFLKKTKHSKIPYENSYYSYVVIKKGKRPSKPQEFVKAAPPPSIEVAEETLQEDEQVSVGREASNSGLELVYPDQLNEEERARLPNAGDTLSLETERQQVERKYRAEQEDMELQEHIRQSSYHWRRIIYSPMKASGHVTMDACTPTGKVARLVIPRSQGKQEYYDARKSSWGDLLPHEPKNGEIVRKRGIRRLAGVEATDEMPEEDDMSAMQELLASMSKEGSPSGSGIKMKPVKDKNSRREGHRRRRDWRREESMGYRA